MANCTFHFFIQHGFICRTSDQLSFPSSYTLILGKSRKYFLTNTIKTSVFLKPQFLQKVKLLGDQLFPLDWPKSSAKSWQHCHWRIVITLKSYRELEKWRRLPWTSDVLPVGSEVNPLQEGTSLQQVDKSARGHWHVQAPTQVKVTQPVSSKN